MPTVMVALPNIGGALCSTPKSSASDDPHLRRASRLSLFVLSGSTDL